MNKIEEAQETLEDLGMPRAQSNEISAYTFLALCGISENDKWNKAYRRSLTITKGIMTFIYEKYEKEYAPNTRETFRRQVLHQFVQARVADYNPDNPELPTNSPKAHYAITDPVLAVAKYYGKKSYMKKVDDFIKRQGSLRDKYSGERKLHKVPVKSPDGSIWELSPGKHNILQADIVEEFASRFIESPQLLYLGDTAKKNMIVAKDMFKEMNVNLTEHDKLPDVVILDKKRNWLFLIEAVTFHGPMSPKRIIELKKMFDNCNIGIVFVSAFPNFTEFKRHSNEIAWETEVWISENPDHLIHYNGDRFYGPR